MIEENVQAMEVVVVVVLNGEGLAQHWHSVVDMGVRGLPWHRHRHWQTCLKTSTSLVGFALGLSNFLDSFRKLYH